MQDRPTIKTAIPKQRYQIGDHSATVLGEIESDDPRQYRWIAAFIQMGQSQPRLYVCCELAPASRRGDGRYDLRVISDLMSEVVDTADRWGDVDAFSQQAIDLGRQMLGLQQEQPIKLM